MVLQDIVDEIRDHGFTDTLDARLIGFINDAYYDVCSRHTWNFLEKQTTFSIVSANDTPTMPTDLGAVLAIGIDSMTQTLVPVRQDDVIKRAVGQLTAVGTPYWYYFIGDTLRVYPLPDQNYTATIDYLAIPTALSTVTPGTTDVPLIPDRHRRVLVLGALVKAYSMEDDPELATVFGQQFEARIQSMVSDLHMKQYDRTEYVWNTHTDDDVWGGY